MERLDVMRDGSIYFFTMVVVADTDKGGIMNKKAEIKQDNRNRLVEIYLKLSEFSKEDLEILLNEIRAIDDIKSVELACGFVENIRKNRNQDT